MQVNFQQAIYTKSFVPVPAWCQAQEQMQLNAQQPCIPIPIPIALPMNKPYSQWKKKVSIVLNDISSW